MLTPKIQFHTHPGCGEHRLKYMLQQLHYVIRVAGNADPQKSNSIPTLDAEKIDWKVHASGGA